MNGNVDGQLFYIILSFWKLISIKLMAGTITRERRPIQIDTDRTERTSRGMVLISSYVKPTPSFD